MNDDFFDTLPMKSYANAKIIGISGYNGGVSDDVVYHFLCVIYKLHLAGDW